MTRRPKKPSPYTLASVGQRPGSVRFVPSDISIGSRSYSQNPQAFICGDSAAARVVLLPTASKGLSTQFFFVDPVRISHDYLFRLQRKFPIPLPDDPFGSIR